MASTVDGTSKLAQELAFTQDERDELDRARSMPVTFDDPGAGPAIPPGQPCPPGGRYRSLTHNLTQNRKKSGGTDGAKRTREYIHPGGIVPERHGKHRLPPLTAAHNRSVQVQVLSPQPETAGIIRFQRFIFVLLCFSGHSFLRSCPDPSRDLCCPADIQVKDNSGLAIFFSPWACV